MNRIAQLAFAALMIASAISSNGWFTDSLKPTDSIGHRAVAVLAELFFAWLFVLLAILMLEDKEP